MRISDLPAPVTASKADWLAGTAWLGFTPTNGSLTARNKCQSTILRQVGKGYVIEYITETFSDPNPGFEHDPKYVAERERHRDLAGRLIAVHRLRTTYRPLEQILTTEEFKDLQDMWAQDGKRYRWSVAFPIIESYRILGHPKAKQVLGEVAYKRLYGQSSARLRPLTDDERASIANLEIERANSTNAWIGIEDEFGLAERSQIDKSIARLIDHDLGLAAREGMTEHKWKRVRTRAAWHAQRFVRKRAQDGTLYCDDCAFDPATKPQLNDINPRSVLDVHHKHPLDEGERYTSIEDYSLLCPTCHRIAHALLRKVKSFGQAMLR